METPANFHGIMRKMNPLRMILPRLATLGNFKQFSLQKKTGFLNRFKNTPRFTLQQNSPAKNPESRPASEYFNNLRSRYGSEFRQHVLHSNLGRSTTPTKWDSMDMVLPTAEPAQPAPQQVIQTGNKIRNVQSFTAGQTIPRLEDDILFKSEKKSAPTRPPAPKRPVISPSARPISRVEEVNKGTPPASEAPHDSAIPHSQPPTVSQQTVMRQVEPSAQSPRPEVPEPVETKPKIASAPPSQSVIQRQADTSKPFTQTAVPEMPLVHPAQPEPVSQAAVPSVALPKTDGTSVKNAPIVSAKPSRIPQPVNKGTPAVKTVVRKEPASQSGQPVVQRMMAKPVQEPSTPAPVKETSTEKSTDIPRIAAKPVATKPVSIPTVQRELPHSDVKMPVVFPKKIEMPIQGKPEEPGFVPVVPVVKPVPPQLVIQRQKDSEGVAVPQEKLTTPTPPKTDRVLVKPRRVQVPQAKVIQRQVEPSPVSPVVKAEQSEVQVPEQTESHLPEHSATPPQVPTPAQKPLRVRQPMVLRRPTPTIRQKSISSSKPEATSSVFRMVEPVVQRQPDRVEPSRIEATSQGEIKQEKGKSLLTQEKSALKVVSPRSKSVPVKVGIVQRMPVSNPAIKLPEKKSPPQGTQPLPKESFPVVKPPTGRSSQDSEVVQRKQAAKGETSSSSTRSSAKMESNPDLKVKEAVDNIVPSPSIEKIQSISSSPAVIQREFDTEAAAEPAAAAAQSKKVDLDKIARQIYPIILRKLTVERERTNGGRR